MRIGILHEGKIPVDRRVVLLPEAAHQITQSFADISIKIQKSPTRCASDVQYRDKGLEVVEEVDDCDVLIGVKEVPIPKLISDKTYFFFSHTIKKQPYNRELLRTILQKNITLIDYERIVDEQGQRLISFGRYAGIVGAYNAFWTYGKHHQTFDIQRASQYEDETDLIQSLRQVYQKLPKDLKVILTGSGRVGKGSKEILDGMGIKQVSPVAYLTQSFEEPVYTHLRSLDYHKIKADSPQDQRDFYQYPQHFDSDFYQYIQQSDILISAHFWNPKAPVLFTHEDMKRPDFKLQVIADITCDIQGSIPCTLRPTTIDDPVFGYDPVTQTEQEAFSSKDHLSVMAIDNLPCELPIGASRMFGGMFVDKVLPHLLNGDKAQVIHRATIAKDGKLTPLYKYLEDYVA